MAQFPSLTTGDRALDEIPHRRTRAILNEFRMNRWDVSRQRSHLIATQAATGHESGSWYFKDQHGDQGGRLYNTAMAVMILEVYYRYMPLYGENSVDDGFF